MFVLTRVLFLAMLLRSVWKIIQRKASLSVSSCDALQVSLLFTVGNSSQDLIVFYSSRSEKSLECTNCGKSFKTIGMLKLHEAKRCSSKSVQNTDVAIEDSSLDGLQNVPYDESLNDTNLMNAEHEV